MKTDRTTEISRASVPTVRDCKVVTPPNRAGQSSPSPAHDWESNPFACGTALGDFDGSSKLEKIAVFGKETITLTKKAVALVALLSLGACMTSGHDGADSKAAIVGPEWVVEDIADRGVIDDARATLLFGNDGRVSGDTSCNRYFAEYILEVTEIRFRNAGVTKRACAPAVMDQESRFLTVFNAVDSYRIDDRTNTLVLSTPAGATITARRSGATQ